MDASDAGEGSLEILVSSQDMVNGEEVNTPTRVEPLGSARFQVMLYTQYNNWYITTWMLLQIFMNSDKVILADGIL